MFKWKRDKISTMISDTFIGEGTIVEGAIRSAGSVRLEGQLRGDLFCEGDVVLGESAFAVSNITARNLILAGQVTGNVRIRGKITILATGKLYGDMEAESIAIEEGGIFQGNSSMDMGEPVITPLERRGKRDRRVAADPNWKGEERRIGHERRHNDQEPSVPIKKISYRAPETTDKVVEAVKDAELAESVESGSAAGNGSLVGIGSAVKSGSLDENSSLMGNGNYEGSGTVAVGATPDGQETIVSSDPLRESGRAFLQSMSGNSLRMDLDVGAGADGDIQSPSESQDASDSSNRNDTFAASTSTVSDNEQATTQTMDGASSQLDVSKDNFSEDRYSEEEHSELDNAGHAGGLVMQADGNNEVIADDSLVEIDERMVGASLSDAAAGTAMDRDESMASMRVSDAAAVYVETDAAAQLSVMGDYTPISASAAAAADNPLVNGGGEALLSDQANSSSAYGLRFEEQANSSGPGQAHGKSGAFGNKSANSRTSEEAAALLRNW